MEYRTPVSEEQFRTYVENACENYPSGMVSEMMLEYIRTHEVEPKKSLIDKINNYQLNKECNLYRAGEVDKLIGLYKELTEQVKKCFNCKSLMAVDCSHCNLETTKNWLLKEE